MSPLSGLLGDRCNRIHVVAAGTLLWGGMTAAIGMATTLQQVPAVEVTVCLDHASSAQA